MQKFPQNSPRNDCSTASGGMAKLRQLARRASARFPETRLRSDWLTAADSASNGIVRQFLVSVVVPLLLIGADWPAAVSDPMSHSTRNFLPYDSMGRRRMGKPALSGNSCSGPVDGGSEDVVCGYTQGLPTDNEFTRILQWPGYRVYRHALDEKNKTLELWVRRKRGNRKLECSGCGRKFGQSLSTTAGSAQCADLPWSLFRTSRSHRGVSGPVPGMRREDREGAATAEQGAVQQTLRGRGGRGMRECAGTASGSTFRAVPERTVRAIRLAIPGAMGGG